MSETFARGKGRANLRMIHAENPREAILASVGDISGIELFHNDVLVAIYVRPEQTAGGVFLPDKSINEDRFQGKVGLVLAVGPMAFVDDERNKFGGKRLMPGEWVAFRVQDGWQLGISGPDGKVDCRVLEDTRCRMRIKSPDDVY